MISIRRYRESDAEALWNIYFTTIRKVNIRDYSQSEVEAWAPDNIDLDIWKQDIGALSPFIATVDDKIVGYADLQPTGLIDHFFCNHEHQGQGVGRALMEHLLAIGQAQGINRFYSEVSITARPFYERFGFSVSKEQEVEIRGEKLKNFLMERL